MQPSITRPISLAPWPARPAPPPAQPVVTTPAAALPVQPLPAPQPRGGPIGPKERGLALRLAVRWATENSTSWADQMEGLRPVLVTPSMIRARLEATTKTGGTVLVRAEGRRLHLVRIELGWTLTLTAELPTHLWVG